jgi:type IV fimbrial biogenesis protein FimT
MLSSRMRQSGVTLIEMLVAISIIATLMFLALPNMATWLNNSQIRTTAETLLAGINVARTEALRRNAVVRFQLANSLDSSCALSATGTNWVVSLGNPAGLCDKAPASLTDPDPPTATDPKIIQKKSGTEGSRQAEVTATGGSTLYFSGIGRLTSPLGVPNITAINITNPVGGSCQHVDATNGTMRCLRITISTGGQIKMCDPAVTTDPTDPRTC